MERRKRQQFWGKDEDDDSLVRNVIAGRKTATASVASEYGIPYGEFGDSSLHGSLLLRTPLAPVVTSAGFGRRCRITGSR